MSKWTNLTLYELIKQKSKEKGRPVKVICDWDECLQPLKPRIFYEFSNEKKAGISFKEFFQKFWREVDMTCSSPDGYKIHPKTEEERQIVKIFEELKSRKRTDPNFYNHPQRIEINCFLSIVDELLIALKEYLISDLVVISGARKGKADATSGSKERGKPKRKYFDKTFGKFPQTQFHILEFTVNRKEDGGNTPKRWEWIKENCPDFDVFIDDNNYLISQTCSYFNDKEKVYIMPDYKCNKGTTGSNIHHVKTTVSDLKIEDFEKVAEEIKAKKPNNLNPAQNPKSYWPWIIGGSIVGGILIVGLIIYFLLRGKKNSLKQGVKT